MLNGFCSKVDVYFCWLGRLRLRVCHGPDVVRMTEHVNNYNILGCQCSHRDLVFDAMISSPLNDSVLRRHSEVMELILSHSWL